MTADETPTRSVRTLESNADDDAVRSIFRATLALGNPLAVEPIGLAAYERLCLGWYLGQGRADARLLVEGDQVLGYALVCTNEPAHDRWVRHRALRLAPRAISGAARSAFWRKRLRDAVGLRRSPRPAPAHAHMNLLTSARAGLGALALCMAVDDICRASGHDAWYGEINARAGRRAAALERVFGEVVHRAPNHTLTWVAGTGVERLTVLRRLDGAVAA